MQYYPVFLNVEGKPCLVVGGGAVGTRKVESLLHCGALVTVVSPVVTPRLAELAEQGDIVLELREYDAHDLDDAFLVFAATDDSQLNQSLHDAATQRKRLCNIVDQPERCSFVVPAVVRQGDLSVAISTGGRSPALAKHLRRQLNDLFGAEYGVFLSLMGAIRSKLLAGQHAPDQHRVIFNRLIQSDLLERIKQDDRGGIDDLLRTIVGPGYNFESLMESI